jgi:uncharacterized protein YeaO (DUF488 family)
VDRYRTELDSSEAIARLKALAAKRTVTLVYSARDERHNNARALLEILNHG